MDVLDEGTCPKCQGPTLLHYDNEDRTEVCGTYVENEKGKMEWVDGCGWHLDEKWKDIFPNINHATRDF